ncbi:MAG TPA: MOSC domain-containing protein [Acidiphilium sp.]|uniref:MOSC domain-containing protein n=1 Tax=unclassified Acidiphilium TaxID=2617493 RepID=UPI000BD1CB0C|nr:MULTISPECIES: MOSC N-terminal beta barrel domain-containing protein [unclassified Acidiphilium]OYV55543.1 MAG: sulfurase [Acidiphilium sp. 20-67-58]HQT60128.1 MOSC domain-containing protein [Acidiphilium sp.]HQU11097.1 MOSC domain-containing protein [Acidiphilium sp.]
MTMLVDQLFRYPVKGLTGEALAGADLETGRAIAWDRAFALAQGDCGFDPAAPDWRPKTEFLCLARNPNAIGIDCRFNDATCMLTLIAPDGAAIDASPLTEAGRDALGAFLAAALPAEMRGTPRFHHVSGHSFSDHRNQVISLIGLSSLRALEAATGAPRHRLRFRANVYFEGAEPWAELGWVGRTLAIGAVRLRVTARIDRCAATTINPETRARDANPVKELMTHFGHVDCGIYAEIVHPGRIAPGDPIILLP